ncbi:MAG: hypothetical protein JWN48_1735, partial [Myxococcaceae bacterium]|nr:hypothetical protein [Myxococcaceae bacterium]
MRGAGGRVTPECAFASGAASLWSRCSMTQTSVLRAWSVAAASLRDSATRSCAGAEPSAALARARSAAARFGLVAALLPMLITLGCLPAYYDDKRNQSSSAQPPEPFNGGPVALDAGRRLDATAADGRIVVPQCPSNLLDCDGLCFDPRSTAEHCGACGNVCLAPARCVAGTCEPTCTAGEQLCAGTCIDVQSDPAHCGSCSGSCRAEQTCRAGSCAAPTSDWQTLGGNMQRTGDNGREQGTPPLAPGWAVSLVAAPLQPVVVEGTRVFVSYATRFAESGPLFALDVATGNQLWVHDFGRVGDVGQPTVRDGRVYLELSAGADFSSQLAVLRADSGAVVWTRELESQLQRYWAPTVTAAAIYLDSGDGDALHALRRSTGAELFVNGELEAYDAWSAAADDRGVYTFVAGKLRRHDLQTGAVSRTMSVTWTGAEHSMMTAPVLAAEGTVYVIAPP